MTFEYVLLGGVNDQPEHAREVLALLAGMRAKVNLIVWNPGPGIEYHQPTPEDVAVFQRMLIDGGIPTFMRRPRGRDIYAACGQLKRTVEPVGIAGEAGGDRSVGSPLAVVAAQMRVLRCAQNDNSKKSGVILKERRARARSWTNS